MIVEAIFKAEEEGRGLLLSTTGPWPKGTGVRPELLSVSGNYRNWRLTPDQVVRMANRLRAEGY